MCRWAAYIGEPRFIADVVSKPSHSLIAQAREADECKTAINADGFGLAWYAHRAEPGLYRDVFPAWSDPNLKAISEQVKSRLFLAHVRASTGSAVSRNNCHPFAFRNWSFMHNGQIAHFDLMRQKFDSAIPEHLYHLRKGASDSEALFLIALGQGLEADPKRALQKTTAFVHEIAESSGLPASLRMTLAFSDGNTLYAVRFASSGVPPTLYYRRNNRNDGWLVVSEPLHDGPDWQSVDANSFCTFTATDVAIENFALGLAHKKAAQLV